MAFLSFKIAQERIVAEECVERNQAVNTCQGSCQLREILQINEDKPLSEPIFQVDNEELKFFWNTRFKITPFEINKAPKFKSQSSPLLAGFDDLWWHPPRV
jgi:hypothetical protein